MLIRDGSMRLTTNPEGGRCDLPQIDPDPGADDVRAQRQLQQGLANSKIGYRGG